MVVSNDSLMFLVVLFAAALIALFLVRAIVERRLVELLGRGKIERFLSFSSSVVARALVPPFNLTFMRLNAFLMSGDAQEAAKTIEVLLAAKKSKAQEKEVLVKAYRFFLEQGDVKRAQEQFYQIQERCAALDKKQAGILKDIFIDKRSGHIQAMQSILESNASGVAERFEAAYLLAVQYRNIGDSQRALLYERMASSLAHQPINQ